MKKKVLKYLKWFAISFVTLFSLLTLIIYLNRDNICQSAIDEINQKLKSPLQVKDVNLTFWSTFPNLSVDLKEVFIAGLKDAKPSKEDTLLYSSLIRLRLNPFDLWKENYEFQSIEINSGKIQLRVDENGKENFDILKPEEEKEDDSFRLKLKNVAFNKMGFSYENKSTNQHYNTILNRFIFSGDFNEKQFKLNLHGDLNLNYLKSGPLYLLKNKKVKMNFSVSVNQLKNEIIIPSSVIDISGLPFNIKGKVSKADYAFQVKTKDVGFKKLIESFNAGVSKDIKSLQGNGEIYFNLLLRGNYNKNNPPIVNCSFGVIDGALIDPIHKSHIKQLNLTGSYSNDSNEVLLIDTIKCITKAGPFLANLKISEFNNPRIKGHSKGEIDLGIIHKMLPLPYVDVLNGRLRLDSDFDFTIKSQNSSSSSIFLNKMNGVFKLKKATISLKDDPVLYEDIFADFELSKKHIGLKEVKFNVSKSEFSLTGSINGLEDYFENGVLAIDLNVVSDYLNANDFLSESDSIDNKMPIDKENFFPSNVDANVSMEIKEFRYDGHAFNDLNANLALNKNKLNVSNLNFHHADAPFTGSINLLELEPEMFNTSTVISCPNLKLSSILKEWDNFDQTVLDSLNTSGSVNVKIKFVAPFNLNDGFAYEKIQSEIDFSTKKVRLKNVESLNELGDYLNHPLARLTVGSENVDYIKRNLSDVKINPVKNKILIKDSKVIIPLMNISSSFINLNLNGEHAFTNQIDYYLSFHLNEAFLKKQRDDFGEIIDEDKGMEVFLSVSGTVDNPIVKWDKESSRKKRKEKIISEKKQLKSMLKKDFGLYKKDTTVKAYVPEKEIEDKIEIDFNDDEAPVKDSIKKKKPSKLQKKIDSLKQKLNKFGEDLKEEEEEEFDFD